MSNALAIAAVTATLRNLLTQGVTREPDLADTVVTTHVPDAARTGGTTANQINLFLYQAVPNAAWRNADPPGATRPSETGFPPLALDLYYLLTTYGRDNDVARPFSHELLGRAMSVLHDHPVLGATEIASALPGNDLGTQVERIRFSLQPLGVEEIYRLWTGFQTPYRTSVAYEASVVLIESVRENQAPLPVLQRGVNDRGAAVRADIAPPFATIFAIAPTVDLTFGDTLSLTGAYLSGGAVSVTFASPRLATPRIVPVLPGGTDTTVRVTIPNDGKLPAGRYGISVGISTPVPGGVEMHTSNETAIALAPQITSALPKNVASQGGAIAFSLDCAPSVVAGQRVALLFGDREIPADLGTRPANTLTFSISNVTPGAYFVRLRVDGADSTLLVDRTKKPPTLDPQRRVIVT
ncbi:MAG: DUF4255 domain-containing protein [Vulcanimicrobiaceae bacterium]